ncbi:hypothetical protein QYE76_013544 [Lolium multiflorum]|uniref:Reverse transcriptase RNase H-like domain-containing protein n=1 Tax=Lolium multiflorum TaxID=4521 RepID=A0AAD8U1C5_LOLMU|nr:hypothetical protein QYE76_013544 [Lolium multiflorum]
MGDDHIKSDVELVVRKEKLHKPKVQHEVHDVPSIDVGDVSTMPIDDKPVLVGDKPDEATLVVDVDVASCAIVPVCVDASIQTDDVYADVVSAHMAQMRVGGVGGERVSGDSGQRHYRARSTAFQFSATPRMHRGKDGRGLLVYEKEYLAILLAVQQWRPYLQIGEFVIRTDHKSLTHLSDQRLHTDWQRKALTKLMGLQYQVMYKGILNGAADALSRKPVHSSKVLPHVPLPDAARQIPVQVLQRRVRQQGHITMVQVLVQWSGASEEMATWEDLDSLKQRFPRAPAWGQAGIQGVGGVSDQPTADACTSPATDQGEGRGLGPEPRPARTKKAPARYTDPAWTS